MFLKGYQWVCVLPVKVSWAPPFGLGFETVRFFNIKKTKLLEKFPLGIESSSQWRGSFFLDKEALAF
jgi:hypothetical protein